MPIIVVIAVKKMLVMQFLQNGKNYIKKLFVIKLFLLPFIV